MLVPALLCREDHWDVGLEGMNLTQGWQELPWGARCLH